MEKYKAEELSEDHRIPSSKRMLSTEDPDYTRPPDPKRIKEMEERAQDELRERVIKVVDRVLCDAINEKQTEMEEVDSRILRMQQCLHTLRYCVSLNYHAASKLASSTSGDKQCYEAHPTVRKHMGKAPASSTAPSPSKTSGNPLHDSALPSTSLSSNVAHRDSHLLFVDRLSGESFHGTSSREMGKSMRIASPQKVGDCNKSESSLSAEVGNKELSKNSGVNDQDTGKNLKSSRPPSPKYLPPKPPDTETIAQGRHQRFQTKRRIVVGNTYQYLTPQAGREAEDAMRYKWQIYVRVPPQEGDIASYVSDVTFILDRSYAPHHVINLTHPPFVLSRRGWGEFKVQIVLKFHDSRNKQVQLLHPLVLRRPDDPLALTGLWRLGQENWYDIWVYEGSSSEMLQAMIEEEIIENEEVPATLKRELHSGIVSAQVDGNITVSHSSHSEEMSSVNLQNGIEILTKKVMTNDEAEILINNDETSVSKSNSAVIKMTVSDNIGVNKDDSESKLDSNVEVSNSISVPQTSGHSSCTVKLKGDDANSITATVKEGNLVASKASVSNGTQNKMCKIHVRQPDGRLVPYFIPAHMYSVALKIAQMRSTGGKTTVPDDKGNQKLTGEVVAVSADHQSGESSGSKTVSSSVTLVKGKDITQLENVPAAIEVKKELMNSTVLSKDASASDIKSSSSGTVTEIKIPVKANDGNLIKHQGIPVKILNISPIKSTVKPSTATTSSCVRKLAFTSQGKQTLVRSGTLTQSALLQLLSKAGVKDKNTVVQQLLSKTGVKEGAVDMASLQKIQGQLITAQSSQGAKSNIHLMPVKIVQDKSKSKLNERQILTTTSATRIIQQPVSPANIKFVTSNGQFIPATSLTKGITVNTSIRPNTIIKPITVNSTVLTLATASNIKGTSGLKERPNVFMTPDGKILTTASGGLQVVTSQGKSSVSQVNPLVFSTSDKGKMLQMPPLVVRGLNKSSGVLQTVTIPTTTTAVTSSASKNAVVTNVTVLSTGGLVTSVAPSTIRPLIKSKAVTSTTSITVSAPLVTNVTGKITSILPVNKCFAVNPAGLDKHSSNPSCKITDTIKEQELNMQQKWEEQTGELIAVSKLCSSAEACVSLWVRALPLVSESATTDSIRVMFPYRASSWEQFLKWPLGKQRAAEFQRGREVRRWLDKCNVEGLELWTVCRIVGWARRFAHTPLPYRRILCTDTIHSLSVKCKQKNTLSCIDRVEKLIGENSSSQLSPMKEPQEIDVVAIDDEDERKRQKATASPQKDAAEILPLNDMDLISGCEWVGRRASELRVNLPAEELLPGYIADVARAVAWKAVVTFMEDLLRSAYSQAWEEESSTPVIVPPKVISFNHVKDALISTRPEFDLLTSDGLGTFAEVMEELV